jgi:hypothetical protein
LNHSLFAKLRKGENFDLWVVLFERAGGFNTIHHWHIDIYQNNIRAHALAQVQGTLSIASGGNAFHVLHVIEQGF